MIGEVRLKELEVIFFRNFHIFTIDAVDSNNNNGENRIHFRLLIFELLAFEDPGAPNDPGQNHNFNNLNVSIR